MAPSVWQILLVVLVILLFFGAGRLPRVMEDLAKGIKSFKKGMKDEEGDSKDTPQKVASDKPAETAKTKK